MFLAFQYLFSLRMARALVRMGTSVRWASFRARILGLVATCMVSHFGCGASMSPITNQPGLLISEFIFTSSKVPFPQCHASTIAESGDHLVAAWFGGTGEKNPDVGIWLSRLEQGRWTPPLEVANGKQADGSRFASWNPVLFQPRTGPL
jgi:hypothetical protein